MEKKYTKRSFRNFIGKNLGPISLNKLPRCVCVFIPSPVRVGTLLSEVPGTPIGASFFKFEIFVDPDISMGTS